MKDKMTNQTIVDIRQTEDTVYNPLEIKENFTQTQIEKTAEMLGIEKKILIRFNKDMKKQGKSINVITFEKWLIKHNEQKTKNKKSKFEN
ncbi:hypothetical protein QUF15_10965 [Lactococcus lactis]|nr:hypothetical protein [Lactococcus lactis]MDM7510788.1 hypothetical protein [Lactococcus lactis]MDM7651625.1 hypothetical protein [Lactococcus lactis]